ncbi:MAG: hypothetical protein NWE75_05190 [Candidatus Bathyarchaeota archaeon]|nr:hypothetical protein [Candidatus Bathyarchaeota archaeon]
MTNKEPEVKRIRKGERENLFNRNLKVINIGVETFADDLKRQGVEVVQVDWRPPAGGDVEILKLLNKLEEGSDFLKRARSKRQISEQ